MSILSSRISQLKTDILRITCISSLITVYFLFPGHFLLESGIAIVLIYAKVWFMPFADNRVGVQV